MAASTGPPVSTVAPCVRSSLRMTASTSRTGPTDTQASGKPAANGAGAFTQVLANETNINDGSGGLYDNHGSISSVIVEGSGANTSMLTLDEDFNMGTIQQYDIGTGSEYAGQPSIVMDNRANQVFLNSRADFVRDPNTGNFWVAQYRWTEAADAPSLMCFEEGGTDPIYNSGADEQSGSVGSGLW